MPKCLGGAFFPQETHEHTQTHSNTTSFHEPHTHTQPHTHDKTAYVNYRTFSGIASESLAIHVPEKLENLSKSARYSYLLGGQNDATAAHEKLLNLLLPRVFPASCPCHCHALTPPMPHAYSFQKSTHTHINTYLPAKVFF